jgi:hypothetical protein
MGYILLEAIDSIGKVLFDLRNLQCRKKSEESYDRKNREKVV